MQRQEAEEHLRIIRSLMEKATVYRAISAPTALVAGLLSICAAFVAIYFGIHDTVPDNAVDGTVAMRDHYFIVIWLIVLVLTCSANAAFLYREAFRRGEPFISPGMKSALRSMLPAYFAGALSTFCCYDNPIGLVYSWLMFHGIAVLSTSHFAPKSITWLGAIFLGAWGTMLIRLYRTSFLDYYLRPFTDVVDTMFLLNVHPNSSHASMAATFGLFHLIYAACTWPRKSATHGDE